MSKSSNLFLSNVVATNETGEVVKVNIGDYHDEETDEDGDASEDLEALNNAGITKADLYEIAQLAAKGDVTRANSDAKSMLKQLKNKNVAVAKRQNSKKTLSGQPKGQANLGVPFIRFSGCDTIQSNDMDVNAICPLNQLEQFLNRQGVEGPLLVKPVSVALTGSPQTFNLPVCTDLRTGSSQVKMLNTRLTFTGNVNVSGGPISFEIACKFEGDSTQRVLGPFFFDKKQSIDAVIELLPYRMIAGKFRLEQIKLSSVAADTQIRILNAPAGANMTVYIPPVGDAQQDTFLNAIGNLSLK